MFNNNTNLWTTISITLKYRTQPSCVGDFGAKTPFHCYIVKQTHETNHDFTHTSADNFTKITTSILIAMFISRFPKALKQIEKLLSDVDMNIDESLIYTYMRRAWFSFRRLLGFRIIFQCYINQITYMNSAFIWADIDISKFCSVDIMLRTFSGNSIIVLQRLIKSFNYFWNICIYILL